MTYQPLRKRRSAVRSWAKQARWKLFQPNDISQESQGNVSEPHGSPVSELANSNSANSEPLSLSTVLPELDAAIAATPVSSEAAESAESTAFESEPPSKSFLAESSPLLAKSLLTLRERNWTTAKVALFLLALPWGGAAVAYHWLAAVPEAPNCQSPSWSQAEFERLQCLTAKMQSGEIPKLISGIRQLKAWPEQSPLHSVAQQLLEDWSLVVWSQAQVEYEAGEWEKSARLIAEIPEEFEVWSQAQARSSLWQKVQEQGDSLYQRAEAAIKAQDWQQALNHAKELATLENDYWRQQGLHKLPALIEEQQAAVLEKEPLAQASEGPNEPLSSPVPSSSWVAEPRSIRPRKIRTAPVMVSLTRPKVAQPGQRPPEFSVAS